MISYIIRRILYAVPILIGINVITFLLLLFNEGIIVAAVLVSALVSRPLFFSMKLLLSIAVSVTVLSFIDPIDRTFNECVDGWLMKMMLFLGLWLLFFVRLLIITK